MNLTKLTLAAVSVLTLGALTACQSTPLHDDNDRPQRMKDGKHDRKASPEQRENMKKMRAEQRQDMKQIKAACDGKAAGTTTQVKMGDQTIDGTCALVFKADRKDLKGDRPEPPMSGQPGPMNGEMRGEHRPMIGDMRGAMDMNRGEPLTDAQRAELTKQFDQRLAERQARQKAFAQACQGQKAGTAIQLKLGEQTINGKCEVHFLPNKPIAPAPQPMAPAPAPM